VVTMDDISNAIISLVRIGAAADLFIVWCAYLLLRRKLPSIRNEPKTP
jgi:hypothetical protein